MNDSVSVTSSSLAVAEKTTRKNGGCVGVFFQLFDWNRRFTKKKLFSKRLLPPDPAKEGSKKFGGEQKPPKLLLIADENSGGFPSNNTNNGNEEDQTPNLVARLMGLESMPPVHHNKKDDSGEFRPQKLQKTTRADRRSVTRFGAEALQLKHVLSQSRKHHHPKLASPVTSTNRVKRNSSRLIGAATRILEPGLQGRNKAKNVISYGQRGNGLRSEPVLRNGLRPEPVLRNGLRLEPVLIGNRLRLEPVLLGNRLRSEPDSLENGLKSDTVKGEDLDIISGHTSCKSCGNLIDIDRIKKTNNNNFGYDHEREFFTDGVSMDRYLINQHSPSTYYDENNRDRVKVNTQLSGQTRSKVMAKGDNVKFESARVNCLSPRPKRRVTHTKKQWKSCGIVGSSINGPQTVSNLRSKPDYRAQIGNKNGDDPITFRFNSPMKNNPNGSSCKPTSRKRVTSNPSDEKIHVLGFGLQPVCFSSSRYEASFSNDSCGSSSLEDSSVRTQHADSMSYSYDDESQLQESDPDPFYPGVRLKNENTNNKLVTDLLTYISHVLRNIDLINSRMMRNIKEVIVNSELVLGHQTPHNPNEINPFFICDLLLELDTLTKVMCARFGNFLGSKNSNKRDQLKRFVFDSLIEYLESKYVQYSKCGFRAWMNLPPFMGFDNMVHEVVEEVRGWMGVGSGELVIAVDMSHGSGNWTEFEVEAYETGAKVEWDIVEMLIDEIVIDVSTGVRAFRV